MKTPLRLTLTTLATACLLLGSGLARAELGDDAASLKKLEEALTRPGSVAKPNKPQRRSIVFDKEEIEAGNKVDCAHISPNADMTAVDFAIQFSSGSANLAPSSLNTVNSIARILALSPDRCVMVEGHTDAIGNPDKNLALSHARAETVVNYVAQKAGIERGRLVPIGKGSFDPLNNLDPKDGRNRRVVFKVVTN